MHLLNKLGDELVQRKNIIMNSKDSLTVDDTIYIVNTRYFQNRIINEEIKNAIMNNTVSIPEFEKVLLKYVNFRKDENQIREEIAIYADKLEKEIKLQELPITRKDMRIGNNLSTINIVKTICLTKDFMRRYVGLEDDEEMYDKVSSKCVIPFFIMRIKKIIEDVSKSETLKSNHIHITSSKPYTKNDTGLDTPILFDFIIEIDIDSLDKDESYNDTINYIRVALDYFHDYYEARIVE